MIEPCVVVPVYNHHRGLDELVGAVRSLGLPCLLVDDGSGETTARALARIEECHDDVFLLTHKENRGKGAAIKTAFRAAADRGYTHAVQIDADGQHDTADIPALLRAAESTPHAVVLGRPIFDSSAPLQRMIGRKVSIFWVRLETLSAEIADPLCGFRCYPLRPTVALFDQVRLGDRMDFDPEVLVRLSWKGMRFVNVETRVRYPEEGLSHFRMVRDNARLSWMYFRLFWGAVLRLPVLAAGAMRRRRAHDAPSQWYAVGERGAAWGPRLTLSVYRLLGKRFSMLLLQPVLAYFFVTDARGRAASRAFLQRVREYGGSDGRAPGLLDTYRHYRGFGESILDRFGFWAGKIDPEAIEWCGREHLDGLVEGGRGGVLVSAHLGSFDILRVLAHGDRRARVKVLLFASNARRINETFRSVSRDAATDIVALETVSVHTAMELREWVGGGGLLGVLGDRISAGARGRISYAPFLGRPAPFPQGPWILAALLQCPVVLIHGLRNEHGGHTVHTEAFAERVRLERGRREEMLTATVEHYASRLERLVCRYPYQWYNFYDFWAPPPEVSGPDAREAERTFPGAPGTDAKTADDGVPGYRPSAG